MNLFKNQYPHPILLASTSTFRKNQLSALGYPFEVDDPAFDENQYKNKKLTARDLSQFLSIEKAKRLLPRYPKHLIIGADQICHLEDLHFSKPVSEENAIKQLLQLQGKWHCLTTSFCILFKNKVISYTDETFLEMRSLSMEEIEAYIKLDNPLKCSGSYMFESQGQRLFSKIKTCDPSSILGLPMMALQTSLLQLANEA